MDLDAVMDAARDASERLRAVQQLPGRCGDPHRGRPNPRGLQRRERLTASPSAPSVTPPPPWPSRTRGP